MEFLALKTWNFGQKVIYFLAFLVKIFKNKKLIKKSEKTFPRYTYLDGFGKFLVICPKIYFFTLVKKIWAKKKSIFGDFSKIRFLAKNLTI